jgi:hypothetical protein
MEIKPVFSGDKSDNTQISHNRANFVVSNSSPSALRYNTLSRFHEYNIPQQEKGKLKEKI